MAYAGSLIARSVCGAPQPIISTTRASSHDHPSAVRLSCDLLDTNKRHPLSGEAGRHKERLLLNAQTGQVSRAESYRS